MQGWQTTYLGMRELPRELSPFELQAFFTFSPAERELIAARRGNRLKLGLALHIGFLRMSGRLLDAFRVIPSVLWRHLSTELGIDAPELASLRAMYGRGRTLFDHQQVACESLGFRWMSEHQRRALVRELRDEVARCADREQLLVRARQWLYEHRLLIVHDRAIRTLIAAALAQLEAETGATIRAVVKPGTLDRWRRAIAAPRADGQTQQSWLWATPAKHTQHGRSARCSNASNCSTAWRFTSTWAIFPTSSCAATPDGWPPEHRRQGPGSKSWHARWRLPASCATPCSPLPTS